MMVQSTDLTGVRQMAPHPYMRKCAPYWKRVPKLAEKSCNRRFGSLARGLDRTFPKDEENPLIGLVPEQGKPSLPFEAINRIQALVEPRFAVVNLETSSEDDTPRPFKDRKFSESDRKEKILKYLKSDADSISIKMEDIDMEFNQPDYNFPASAVNSNFNFQVNEPPMFSKTVVIDSGTGVSNDLINVFTEVPEVKSPLCKLREMREQLPAVTEKLKDATPVTAPFSPASPSCSTSSGSSREGDEETGPKKPLVPYNGIGQIRLWQFLLQSLVKGTHGICWTNRDNFEFQFTHPDAVARAWGRCKTKSKMMTFDKMTRSMRDYYKRNILRKVPNHRLMYQFLDENIKVICREMQKSTE